MNLFSGFVFGHNNACYDPYYYFSPPLGDIADGMFISNAQVMFVNDPPEELLKFLHLGASYLFSVMKKDGRHFIKSIVVGGRNRTVNVEVELSKKAINIFEKV